MDFLQEACSKRPFYAQYRGMLYQLLHKDYTYNLPDRAIAGSIWCETMVKTEALENESPLHILVSCTTTYETIPGAANVSWVTTDYIYFLPGLNASIIRSFPRERAEEDLLPHTIDLTKASSLKHASEEQIISGLEWFTSEQLTGHRVETWQEFENQLRKHFSLS